jgi:hypothetical protein
MARIARLVPLPVDFKQGEMTMKNALAEKGYMRHPGTGIGLCPVQGIDGKYLTGLDPEANYIRIMEMNDPQAAETERNIVRERKARLEQITGLDLGPRSNYYAGVYGPDFNTGKVASRVKLIDGENVFNFNNPHKEIEFWWVTQITDLIAPSLEAWKAGRCKANVQFYVSDPIKEADTVYQKNMSITKAIGDVNAMSLDKQRKVARLLGLPITEKDKPEVVFNQLFSFINKGTVEFGEYKGQNSVNLLNKIASLSDKVLNVKSTVRDAISLRIYNKRNDVIYEGQTIIAESEELLVNQLVLDSKQLELTSLEIRVADKKKLNVAELSGYVVPTAVEDTETKRGRKPKTTEEV